jgi:hypothetical protein
MTAMVTVLMVWDFPGIGQRQVGQRQAYIRGNFVALVGDLRDNFMGKRANVSCAGNLDHKTGAVVWHPLEDHTENGIVNSMRMQRRSLRSFRAAVSR